MKSVKACRFLGIAVLLFVSSTLFAQGAGTRGGGGDPSAIEFLTLAGQIQKWVSTGVGPKIDSRAFASEIDSLWQSLEKIEDTRLRIQDGLVAYSGVPAFACVDNARIVWLSRPHWQSAKLPDKYEIVADMILQLMGVNDSDRMEALIEIKAHSAEINRRFGRPPLGLRQGIYRSPGGCDFKLSLRGNDVVLTPSVNPQALPAISAAELLTCSDLVGTSFELNSVLRFDCSDMDGRSCSGESPLSFDYINEGQFEIGFSDIKRVPFDFLGEKYPPYAFHVTFTSSNAAKSRQENCELADAGIKSAVTRNLEYCKSAFDQCFASDIGHEVLGVQCTAVVTISSSTGK